MFLNKFGLCANVPCGLVKYSANGLEGLPLKEVRIEGLVTRGIANVRLTQSFVNESTRTVDTFYYLPVGSNMKVDHFKFTNLEEPREESEVASTVVNIDTIDTYKVKVGLVQSGHKIQITADILIELCSTNFENEIKCILPNTFTPRFTFNNIEAPYVPLIVTINVGVQGPVKKIVSRTHDIQIKMLDPQPGKRNWTRAQVDYRGQVMSMGNGFALLICPELSTIPRIYAERNKDSVTLMLHYMPHLMFCQQKIEAIFLLDCSGSMSGNFMEVAKSALMVFVKSLPSDSYFNVIEFGGKSRYLFKESKKYDHLTLRSALEYISNAKADLEGTQLLKPLKAILSSPHIPGYFRQIYILSDGDIPDLAHVIGFFHLNAHTTRVFALGIGKGTGNEQLAKIAQAGGGKSAVVIGVDNVESGVAELLQNSFQPILTDIQVLWNHGALRGQQVPLKIKPCASRSELQLLAKFDLEHIPTTVKFEANSFNGPVLFQLNVSEENYLEFTGDMIHKLWALNQDRNIQLESYAQEVSAQDSPPNTTRARIGPGVAKMSTGCRPWRR